MIPYSTQKIDKDDLKKVNEALRSKLITQGKKVEIFEKKICQKVQSKYSIAANSATSALHISCLALGLKKNDYLWTVPNTFVASANCGVYCGAKIDFVDIDQKTLNISTDKLEKKLIIAKKKKKLPKILVAVDFAGNPYDHQKVFNILKKYKVKIISDSSHSLGAKYKKTFIGSCKWTHISVFSFHPVKPITTAEGGVATTNDKTLYKKMKILRNHGISRDLANYKKKIKDQWYYEQISLGYNYRMNEIEAALGISQLKKLNLFNKKRNILAKKYKKNFASLPIKVQQITKNCISTYHLFVIIFPNSIIRKKFYSKIFNFFRKKNIGVNLHYLPVHLQPFYKKMGFRNGNFNVSENYSKRALSIPLYPSLTFQNQNKVIKVIRQICKEFFNDEKFK